MSNLADEAALEETAKTDREGKRLAKMLNGAVKIAGQEAANEFEVTLQRAKEEKEAEEMEMEEKDFKQELGITEGKCASP
jgi:lipopolysaccharide export system protein LptC